MLVGVAYTLLFLIDPPPNGEVEGGGHKAGVRGPRVMPAFDPSKARAGLKKSAVAVSFPIWVPLIRTLRYLEVLWGCYMSPPLIWTPLMLATKHSLKFESTSLIQLAPKSQSEGLE